MDTEMEIQTPIGALVYVYSLEDEEWGYGTYMGEVSLEEAARDLRESGDLIPDEEIGKETIDAINDFIAEGIKSGATTPKIILENDDVVYGFMCWWQEATEASELQH